MHFRRLFLYLLIASISLSALIGIVVVLMGNFGEFETNIILTTLTIAVTSILGLACGVYLESGRGRLMPIAGIVLALFAAVLWIIIVWTDQFKDALPAKLVLSSTLVAAACSLLSLLSLAKLDRRFAWSRWAAHAAIWSLSGALSWMVWTEFEAVSETTSRIIGVLSIIAAALTVVTPVFHKLSNTEMTPEQIRDEIEELEARIYNLNQERIRIESRVDDDLEDENSNQCSV